MDWINTIAVIAWTAFYLALCKWFYSLQWDDHAQSLGYLDEQRFDPN